MNPVKKLVTVAAAALVGAVLTPQLTNAQAPGRPESTLTITDRTEVPGGVILDPGSYIVQVAQTQSSWNVVTIQNPDRSKTFATVLTTPHTAKDAIPNSTFVFYNTPSDQPKALRSWFPPNDRFGQDFVYAKDRGEQLAKLTNQQVPEQTAAMTDYEKSHPSDNTASSDTNRMSSTDTTSTSQDNTSSTSTSAANAQPGVNPADQSNTITPPATTAQENTGSTWKSDTGTSSSSSDMTASNDTTRSRSDVSRSNDEDTTATRSNRLPRTASPFPLLALAGVSALGLGFAVRRFAA